MHPESFRARFAGYNPEEIDWFFQKIKMRALRPKETEVHCRNKLLLWLDKLHNCLSYEQLRDRYRIGTATAKIHVSDVLKSILKSFEKENVIAFPQEDQKILMENILKQKGAHMPYCLLSMDGCHTRCTGRQIAERLSHKYKWLPCFNVTFLIERVFGTICAFNLDQSAAKHDITILREAWFHPYLNEIMQGWIILADKGYVGIKKDDIKCIAPVMKKGMKERKRFAGSYWHEMNLARSEVERVFAHFFTNKFTQLSKWQGKSKQTFIEFSANVICCIILFNTIKLRFRQTNFLLSE